ncbi:DEAD/DEAH box helicase family protein [Cupriavidus plantarum]|uniref:DEAD/DEAH box helicase family protein n=1 Tax=Cupriavidus plantarum TaxID=942865 RepID=UPI00339D38B4
MPFDPRPHQITAISDVVTGFASHDRGQLVMACGTGKTLTAYWISVLASNGTHCTRPLMASI